MPMTNTISADQWRTAAVDAFTRTAKEMIPSRKVQVQCFDHPSTAAVHWDDNGKTVQIALFLPVMKPGARLTRQDATALAGYWVHELCHVLYTDRTAWEDAVSRGEAFRNLVNGLEDIRIERKVIAALKIPGARELLEAITERAVWQVPVDAANVNNKRAVAALLAYLGRERISGYNLPRAPFMWQALTPANRKLCATVLAQVDAAQSTADIVAIVARNFTQLPAQTLPQWLQDALQELADKMDDIDPGAFEPEPDDLSELDADAPQGQGQAEPQDGPKQETDQDADENAQGQGQGDGQADDQQGGNGTAAGNPQGDETGGGKDDLASVDVGAGGNSDKVDSAEPDDMARNIADKANGGPIDAVERDLLERTDNLRRAFPNKNESPENTWLKQSYESLKSRVSGINAMRTSVKRIIQSPDRVKHARRLETGRFDVRAAGRAKIGAKDVFKRRRDSKGHKAAVAITLDNSYSMGRDTADQAALAIHLAECIEQAGCKLGVFGFKGNQTIAYIKRFDQAVKKALPAFVWADNNDTGSTPLSETMLRASGELAKQDATAHVLFVLTDGGDNNGKGAMDAACKFARARGQTVIGVCIGNGARIDMFEHADARIKVTAGTLTGSVFKALIDQLDKQRVAA